LVELRCAYSTLLAAHPAAGARGEWGG